MFETYSISDLFSVMFVEMCEFFELTFKNMPTRLKFDLKTSSGKLSDTQSQTKTLFGRKDLSSIFCKLLFFCQ